ncbi:MAG: cadherin repeat domain-containing protein, partial [Gemmataceae bacterium]|nr:cadherin repeat domain-containing protein [Gemmataceae bacterium]
MLLPSALVSCPPKGRPRWPARARLSLEPLEDRCVPAVFAVNSLADVLNPIDIFRTLREAILLANSTPGADRIIFSPPASLFGGTLNLGTVLPELSDDVSIEGPGADRITIRRNQGGDYRLFTVRPGVTATIADLTLTNGRESSSAIGGGQRGVGGAIFNAGTLTVRDSVLSGNTATGDGGAIYNAGTLSVLRSTLSGNSSLAVGGGGGIRHTSSGTLNLSQSTLVNNTAGLFGGGLHTTGPTTVTNTTFSANRAGFGGGIRQSGSTLTITHSTFTGNRGGVNGGGLFQSSGTLVLRNTIVAGNFRGVGTSPSDVVGTLGAGSGFNLIGGNPGLGPLANNGGPTRTHALLLGSPAIDRGAAVAGGPTTDQRGLPRVRDFSTVANAPSGNGSDIGAFELQVLPSPPTNVTLSFRSVAENSPAGTRVGTLIAADPDIGDTHTFSLLNNAGGRFRIVGNELQVAPGAVLDFEASPSHTIRVQATDSTGLSFARDLDITLIDVNEVTGFDVQRGASQRSYVRHLDVLFEDSAGLTGLLGAGRVQLTRRGLDGSGGSAVSLGGVLSISGNRLLFDFGVQGLGGNRISTAGDGYYEVAVDSDGDGVRETRRYFYRLLGDVNADRTVNALD